MPARSRTRTSTTRANLLAVSAAAAVVLGGCADPGTSPDPTTGSSSSPSASPTESSTPTPTATTYPDDVATNGTTTLGQPTSGATVPGPKVTVSGTATAFEATLNWEVVPAGGGDPVAEGFTTAGANGEVGPFSFTVDLDPGTWTVRVWEPDMSDGEGTGDGHLVRATFTVE